MTLEHPLFLIDFKASEGTTGDVERAFAGGVDATGAASAALEADDRDARLRSIAAVPGSVS